MTAHVVVHELDPDLPATLSPKIMRDLLRDDLGFKGVVITDDLEMAAVADRYEIEEMIERGLESTVDIFLICHTFEKFERALQRVIDLANSDPQIREAIFRSANRIAGVKRSLLGSWPKPWTPEKNWRNVLGAPEHVAVLAGFGDASFEGDDPTKRS